MSVTHSCPYCGSSYRYGELLLMNGKRHECHFCRRTFQTRKRLFILLILPVCAILVAADLLLLNSSDNISVRSFLVMTAADAAVIFLTFLFIPLFTRLKKDERQ